MQAVVNSDRRLIILGLTGPVGSGCTEVSRIFDDDNNNIKRSIEGCTLFKFLTKEEYISIDKEDIIPRYDKFDTEINKHFDAIRKIDDKLKEFRSSTKDEKESVIYKETINIENIISDRIRSDTYKYKELKREIFNDLKTKLEARETLKSLDTLDEFIDGNKHRFVRISVSDVIIFHTLANKKDHIIADKDKEKDIKLFISIRDGYRDEINKIVDSIKNMGLLSSIDYLCDIREILKFHSLTNSQVDEIANIIRRIVWIIRNIKEDFEKNKDVYRTLMQDFGDNIRKNGNPFDYSHVKDGAILDKKIHHTLAKDLELLINFHFEYRNYSFFIIDSFRNPYEALYFKKKYIDFFLISLYASENRRKERLGDKFDETSDERDQGELVDDPEDIFYMQHVPRTVKYADIAINNDENYFSKDNSPDIQKIQNKLTKKIIRYLALIFDTGCTKPNDDEVMMNLAYTMAMKSNCISRQVGAVIEGKDGYIVGAGWNDVGEGKISCGLREIRDIQNISWYEKYLDLLKEDEGLLSTLTKQYQVIYVQRQEIERFCFCFKDQYSMKKFNKKIKGLDIHDDCKDKVLNNLSIKQLEYCEALHAEENAIIQGAKIGGMGISGGKIYTTAFPCELCAKKIQHVGIKEIIYTEPYPGSISLPIFLDNSNEKVHYRQFEGVMPYSYFKLFKVVEDQKEWQLMRSKGLVE